MQDEAKLAARKARFASSKPRMPGLASKGSRSLNEHEQTALWVSLSSKSVTSQLIDLRILRESLIATNSRTSFATAVWELSIQRAIAAQQFEIVLPCLKFLLMNLLPQDRQYYLELYAISLCNVDDLQEAVSTALECSSLSYVDAVIRKDAFTWRQIVDMEEDTSKRALMTQQISLFREEIQKVKNTFKTRTSWPEKAFDLLAGS